MSPDELDSQEDDYDNEEDVENETPASIPSPGYIPLPHPVTSQPENSELQNYSQKNCFRNNSSKPKWLIFVVPDSPLQTLDESGELIIDYSE